MNFVVLSSSRGTTFQGILDRTADGALTAEFLGLIADREDRGCVAKARAAKVPVRVVTRIEGEEREAYDARISTAIDDLGGNANTVIAAIGWLLLLSPSFVADHRGKILNVHPSLLPKHPGMHAHEDVLKSGDRETGMTIHLIDDGMDTGKILLQKSCPVLPNDTPETLKGRVQELEKEWYPKVLQMLETGKLRIDNSA
ncbi:MAG: phosphoribosylglycinamide formyltransferase [Candidatus Peregrinibacteria bacterium]|nr:phosphoribosylglycinamide formyltransferase [Candidatus Peregrinibacteria bacterium]